jgi:chromosome segregation ATPase
MINVFRISPIFSFK